MAKYSGTRIPYSVGFVKRNKKKDIAQHTMPFLLYVSKQEQKRSRKGEHKTNGGFLRGIFLKEYHPGYGR